MIKTIFFDIDGTILDPDTFTIPKKIQHALLELKKRQFHIVIASGRDMESINHIFDIQQIPWDGFITGNGSCIYDKNKKLLYHKQISPNDVSFILNYAKKNNITLLFESLNTVYRVTSLNPYVEISNRYYNEITPAYKEWNFEPIIKINAFTKQFYNFRFILEHTDVTIISTPTTCYDIIPSNTSKLQAIKKYFTINCLDSNMFMCFGDHDNDIEMIQGANIGVAVKSKHGSNILQKIADDCCESVKNDGIYHYLKNHHYI